MSDIVLTDQMQSLKVGRRIANYTGVVIHAGKNSAGKDITYSVGNSAGYVLEFDHPFGSREMAGRVLAGLSMREIPYQPFESQETPIDPAVEIGDGIVVSGETATVWSIGTPHNALMAANVSAPFDEELNHEWKYVPRETRTYKRESAYTRASLALTKDEIALEVSRAKTAETSISASLSVQADRITSEIARARGQESKIDQRLNSITFSVTGTNGTSTFTITDGKTILATDTFDLSVKAINVKGQLTADQIAAGAIDASKINVSDLSAIGATIGGWSITGDSYSRIYKATDTCRVRINAYQTVSDSTAAIEIHTKEAAETSWGSAKFSVSYGGTVRCSDIKITGGEMTGGSVGGASVGAHSFGGITIPSSGGSAGQIIIPESNLADDAVTADKIKDREVKRMKFALKAIDEAAIDDEAIIERVIAQEAIVASKVKPRNATYAGLGDGLLTSGINTSLGYANSYNTATTYGTGTYPSYFTVGSIWAKTRLYANALSVGSYGAFWKYGKFVDNSGNESYQWILCGNPS